ncbi:MAG: sugar O-acetyltransferase [Bacteroidales bacterium]|nr:sugar O-acetyltransferase [Bacteroidales bacterium]
MTEKEKCALGLLYDANYDAELIADRRRCKVQCHRYNSLSPDDEAARSSLMRSLLGATGRVFTIEQPFHCDYGYNIEIGENFYTNVNCVILDGAKVRFGDNVFVAPNCGFYTAGHPLDSESRNRGLEYARPITVEDNVWIGAGVSVLPGVTIGHNSVIGAGSVVNRDIPPHSLAAGNPCRVIRKIDE